jgi:hypothetical protein
LPHLPVEQATLVELGGREERDLWVHAVLCVQHLDRVAAALRQPRGDSTRTDRKCPNWFHICFPRPYRQAPARPEPPACRRLKSDPS